MDLIPLHPLVAALPRTDDSRPVMVQALDGFIDAGHARRLAAAHLLDVLDHEVVARFDVDQILDYRARRPPMVFDTDHWVSYAAPELVLRRLRDEVGTPFLLLTGPEPDYGWERFLSALLAVVDHFEVRLTIGLNAIPMAVPHTRNGGMTAHGTRSELVAGHTPWLRRVEVPAGIGNLIELRLGEAGRDAMGFAVHVPHYVAQLDYPQAALDLLTATGKAAGLVLPTDALRDAASATRAEIDRQVEASTEVAEVVALLEQQYDAGEAAARAEGAETPLPTADELGAELERFLAEQARRDGENP